MAIIGGIPHFQTYPFEIKGSPDSWTVRPQIIIKLCYSWTDINGLCYSMDWFDVNLLEIMAVALKKVEVLRQSGRKTSQI